MLPLALTVLPIHGVHPSHTYWRQVQGLLRKNCRGRFRGDSRGGARLRVRPRHLVGMRQAVQVIKRSSDPAIQQ